MAMHLDPNTSILRAHGKYAGPLAEYEVNKNVLWYGVREREKKGQLVDCLIVRLEKKKVAKPPGRIELPTPGLRDQCSTTEL